MAPLVAFIILVVVVLSELLNNMFGPAGASNAAAIMPGIAQKSRTADKARVAGISRIMDSSSITNAPYAGMP